MTSPSAAVEPPVVSRGHGRHVRTRRLVRSPLLVAAILLASGCGGSGEDAPQQAQNAAPLPPRVVEHAFGRTEIPAAPQRVVVLNQYSLLDYLVAVGVKPVGSTGDPASGYPYGQWLRGRTDGVEMIGSIEAPNLERIRALRPDLIRANPWQTDIAETLAQIAPTIGVPLSYADYEAEFRFVASLVGRDRQAEAVIAGHRKRLEEFKAAMGARLGSTEMSVARLLPDQVRVEGASYVTTLLANAGLRRPESHRTGKGLKLSAEQLPLIDGDVLFVYSAANAATEPDNAKARAAYQQNPLWAGLRAVRNGQVHTVDSFLWAGGGMLWADAVLDDLSGRLMGTRR